MGFRTKIEANYKIVSSGAFKEQHQKAIDEAADEMFKAKVDLANATQQYSRVEVDNPKTEEKIEQLQKEYDDAKKAYKNALELTLDDLKAEKSYDNWKEQR